MGLGIPRVRTQSIFALLPLFWNYQVRWRASITGLTAEIEEIMMSNSQEIESKQNHEIPETDAVIPCANIVGFVFLLFLLSLSSLQHPIVHTLFG